MRICIMNNTLSNQYIDLIGNNDPNNIVVIGPKGRINCDLQSESRFLELSMKHKGTLVFKKSNTR